MPNDFLSQYRAANPDDTRPDDALTLELGDRNPTYLYDPGFKASYDKLDEGRIQANIDSVLGETTAGDYVKQATGAFERGAGSMLTSVPRGIAVAQKIVEDKVPGMQGLSKNLPFLSGATLLNTETAKNALDAAEQWSADHLAPDQVEKLRNSWVATKIPGGLGSALGFLAGGVAGAAVKAPAWLASGTLGTLSTFSSTYDQAKSKGADETTALTAALASTPFGFSEAVPMAKWIERLDKGTGGSFRRALFNSGKETIEEGLQEAFQSAGDDIIAKKLYDKDRKMFDTLAEDAGVGGVTGFLFSMLTHAIGGRLHQTSGDKLPNDSNGAKRPDPTAPPNAPAETAGPLTDLIVKASDLKPEDRSFVEQVITQEMAQPESVATVAAVKQIQADPAMSAYYQVQKPVMVAQAIRQRSVIGVTGITPISQNEQATQPIPDLSDNVRVAPVADTAGAEIEAAQASAEAQRQQALTARRDELRKAASLYGRPDPFAASTPLERKVEVAAAKTEAAPTPEQKESGDYKKGKVTIGGMTIAIETPKGATRSGVSADGSQWSVVMPAHYGEIQRTEGADGDAVDIYVGPSPDSKQVFVVDQIDPKTGKFDEHKAMLGFNSQAEAEQAYQAAFSDGLGKQRMGAIAPMTVDQFRQWSKDGDTGNPLAYVASPRVAQRTQAVTSAVAGTKAAVERGFKALEQRLAGLTEAELKEATKDDSAYDAALSRLTALQSKLASASDSATLPDLLDYDSLSTEAKNGTGVGQGNKAVVFTEGNLTPEQLLADSRSETSKGATRKLAVLQRGADVMVTGVWEQGGVAKVAKTLATKAGQHVGTPVSTMLADGWNVIGALKTLAPTRGFHAEYSAEEWAKDASEIKQRVAAARDTSAASVAAVEAARAPGTAPEFSEDSSRTASDIDQRLQDAEAAMSEDDAPDAGHEVDAKNLITDGVEGGIVFSAELAEELSDTIESLTDGTKPVDAETILEALQEVIDGGGSLAKEVGRLLQNQKANGLSYQQAERAVIGRLLEAHQDTGGGEDFVESVSRLQGERENRGDVNRAGQPATGEGRGELASQDVRHRSIESKPETQRRLDAGIYNAERIPSGAEQASAGGNLQAAESVARRSHEAVRQGDGRNFREWADEPIPAQKAAGRAEVNRAVRPLEEAALLEWAKQNNLLLNGAEFERRWQEDGKRGGQESDVYFDEASQRWFKRNDLSLHGSWLEFFQRLMLHNYLFPESPMRFEGFIHTPNPPVGRRGLSAVFSQPHIRQNTERSASHSDVVNFMAKLGFDYIPNSNEDSINRKTGIVVQDLHDENVFLTPGGNVVVIDGIPVMDASTKSERLQESISGPRQRATMFATQGERSSVARSRFMSIIDGLQAYGIPTTLVREELNGAFAEWAAITGQPGQEAVTLAMADVINPTRNNFIYLLHEAAHGVLGRMSAEEQDAVKRAIDSVTDGALGIEGFNPTVSAASSLSEERLVESTAVALADEGFNPVAARGLAQTIWRMVKGLVLRGAMSVQRMLRQPPNVNLARAYFKARVESALSTAPTSAVAYFGGAVPTKAEQLGHFARLRGSSVEGQLYNWTEGRMETEPALIDSVGAARFNSDLNTQVDDERHSPASLDTGRPKLSDVAGQLPMMALPSNGLLADGPSLLERGARAFLSLFGKSVVAGDGARISIKSPIYKNGSSFALHLMSENSLSHRLGQPPAFNPTKARWIGLIQHTLENAQVRLNDPVHGTKLYAVRYADGTPNGAVHFVVTRPNGQLLRYGVGSEADIVTQFAASRPQGQWQMEVEWEKASDPSKVIPPTTPSPSLGSAAAVTSGQANTALGTVKHRNVSTVAKPAEISPDLETEHQKAIEAAYINAHDATLRAMYAHWDGMGLNPAGLTFDQFAESGTFVRYKDAAAEQIKALNDRLARDGKPPVNPAQDIASLPDEAQKMAALAANRLQKKQRSWLGRRRNMAEAAVIKEANDLTRSNVKLQELLANYTNADAVLATARQEVRASLEEVRSELNGVKSKAYKSGTLMQVMRELNGRMDRPAEAQMRGALERLYKKFTGDEGGRKFFDVLQRVAELSIPWSTAKIGDIRDVIRINAASEPLLSPLLETDADGRALMAMVIAYAKRNETVMQLLELRRAKADTERAAVNALLNQALGSSRDAIKDAKAAAKKLPRLGALADRLLTRLENERERNSDLLASIQRHRAFIDFHKETAPVLNQELARTEKIFGAVNAAWEATHLAEYQVPPSPTATLEVLADKSNTKTLKLTSMAGLGAEVRSHIARMEAWLNAQPAEDRGYVWNTVKAQAAKLDLLDKSFQHQALRGSVSDRLLGSITQKLDGIGHPATKEAARRLRQIQFHIATHTKGEVETGGIKWSAARDTAMKALGMNSEEFSDLRGRALDYIASRADIFAGMDEGPATDKALKELRHYLESDPSTRDAFAQPGAWAAMEKSLRMDQKNSATLKTIHKALGLKTEDGGIFRDLIGASLARVPRAFSAESKRIYQVMRSKGWIQEPHTGAPNGWDELSTADKFKKDPARFQAEMAKRFTPEVWKQFVGELAHMPGRSLFNAPVGNDGIYSLAVQERVRKAFESVAPGDVVGFAQALYTLEGGTTDMAEFVGETVDTLQNYFNLLHRAHQEKAEASDQGAPLPGNALLDARQLDELPPAWLSHIELDQHHMKQVVTAMSFEAGAGRNLKGIRGNFNTASEQLEARDLELQGIAAKVKRTGLKGRAERAALKAEAEAIGGAGYLTVLEQAARNRKTVAAMNNQFNGILKGMFSDVPMEIRPFMQLVKMVAAWTVQGPGTALSDTISLIEQPLRQYGLNTQGLKAAAMNVKYSGADAFNGLLQAFGRKMRLDADNVERRSDLGLVDPDALLTFKEKMAAAQGDTVLGGNSAMTKAARLAQVALNTGIGRAAPGMAPVTTLKPGAVFTQAAQHQHAGVISGTWKMFEDMMGRALEHFAANPADAADPNFQFKPSDLGYGKGVWGMGGTDKALDYMRTRLLQNGMELETMAKKLAAARAVNPNAPTFTKEQYRALAVQGINEVMLESNFTTRMPSMLTNPWVAAASPLVGWSIAKTAQLAGGFRSAGGESSWKAMRAGLSVYAALLPLALAYAWLRDEYDEELLGKKANVQGFGENNLLLAALEKTGRMGTFGVAGDALNSTLNMDTNRPFTVDTRVMFVSSALAAMNAIGTLYKQGGTATYPTVVRPLLGALGGSGYLQYADILNNALSLDNAESRVVARINVSNLLRAAGRELELDVRTGRGYTALPTPTKPWIGQMVLAAYANDAVDFSAAYREAITAARENGHSDDAEKYVAQSFSGYHPLKTVFQTQPTETDYNRLLNAMDDSGRAAVSSANHLFNRYAEQIGGKGFEGRKAKAAPSLSSGRRLDAFRRVAASYGSSSF